MFAKKISHPGQPFVRCFRLLTFISECSIKRYIFAKIKALKIFAPELTCC